MGHRLSKIYTRKGDDGSTSLDGKQRLPKNNIRIEVIGTLDELNSAIGFLLTQRPFHPEVFTFLRQVQQDLFDMGGELCPPHHPVIHAEKISWLENTLDAWNETLPPLKEFILPGGNASSAACHLARTVCRRAERHLVTLNQQEKISPDILRYINRLSDVLFVAARVLSREDHAEEVLWDHERHKQIK